jgi:hypothetical protein
MANVTVTVLEADGTTETDVVVLGVDRQAAALSKSVTLATEDKAVLDTIAASLAVIDDVGRAAEASSLSVAASTEDKAVLDAIAASLALLDNSIASGNELQVDVVGALPAGTNNIGDIDVLSIVPGTGASNLGKAVSAGFDAAGTGVMALGVRQDTQVDLGADGDYVPFSVDDSGQLRVTGGGTQVAADAASGGAGTGTLAMAVRDDALSALTPVEGDFVFLRTNANGALWVASGDGNSNGQATAANSAPVVEASDSVLVTSIPLDDAAVTAGAQRVQMVGFFADEASTDSVNEGDGGMARMTLDRKQIVTPQPHTSGGLTVFKSLDLDETEEDVKTSAGQVYWIYAVNRTTAPLYLRLYNATAANTTVGSTAHLLGPIEIPANASDHTAMTINFGGMGVPFDTAICAAVTTSFADNDTGAPGANHCIVNIGYA